MENDGIFYDHLESFTAISDIQWSWLYVWMSNERTSNEQTSNEQTSIFLTLNEQTPNEKTSNFYNVEQMNVECT
jgi:hypothetical protein